jgi:glc operon protein GlcG
MGKLLSALLCVCTLAGAELGTKKTLTLAAVKEIAAAAEAEARKNNWNVTMAIVDEGGYLLYMMRMDEAPLSSIELSQRKARAAAIYRRPTKALEDTVLGGRTVMLTFPDVLAAQGGVPVIVDGKVIGAVGVSGVQSAQDEQIANAGIATVSKTAR